VHNFYTASLTSHLVSLFKLFGSWNRVTTDSIRQNNKIKSREGKKIHPYIQPE